jgi:hypothetical protein
LFVDELDSDEAFESVRRQEGKLSVSIFDYSASMDGDEGGLRRGTGRLCQTKSILFSGDSFSEQYNSLKAETDVYIRIYIYVCMYVCMYVYFYFSEPSTV